MKTRARRQPYLTDLLIYPTSRCNLKCRHCYFAPTYDERQGRRDDEISYEQICKAVDALLPFGLRACKFSGGEPFLRDDLVDMCHYMRLKNIHVNIETNGTLVTQEQARTLARSRLVQFLSVSLDGACAETHEALRGIPGCFNRAVKGLEYLTGAGLNVQVIAAAYHGNKSELPRVIDLAGAKGAASFRVCFIHAVGRARNLPLIGLEESLEIEQQLAEHAQSVGIRYCSSVPPVLRSVTCIMRTHALNGRCNITSALAILSDGTITICGMGRHAKDFRFGKLDEDDLAEIWQNHPTLTLIREGVPSRLKGVCSRCIMRSACLGYCRLENEDITLDHLFDPFPLCTMAEKLGLLPETRLVNRPESSASQRDLLPKPGTTATA